MIHTIFKKSDCPPDFPTLFEAATNRKITFDTEESFVYKSPDLLDNFNLGAAMAIHNFEASGEVVRLPYPRLIFNVN